MKAFILLPLLLLFSTTVSAQIFQLRRTSNNGAANSFIDTELQKVQNEINKDIPAANPKRLMEGMADSSAASGKGLGQDYMTSFDVFTVGAGIGLAADLEEDKELDSDLSGAGLQGGLIFGIQGGKILPETLFGLDTDRLTLQGTFLAYDLDKDFDDNNVKADLLSFSATATYRWIDGKGNSLFGWDGIKLHTGYQYNKTKLKFTSKIEEEVDEELTAGNRLQGTIEGNPQATIDVSTHSIPVEISSGINFLYILSFYGGLGTDFNFGEAKGKGDINTNPSTLNCTNAAACGGQSVTVASEANIDDNGKVRPLFLRGFAGFQVNLPFVRIFATANKVFGTEVVSVATGLRLAF